MAGSQAREAAVEPWNITSLWQNRHFKTQLTSVVCHFPLIALENSRKTAKTHQAPLCQDGQAKCRHVTVWASCQRRGLKICLKANYLAKGQNHSKPGTGNVEGSSWMLTKTKLCFSASQLISGCLGTSTPQLVLKAAGGSLALASGQQSAHSFFGG